MLAEAAGAFEQRTQALAFVNAVAAGKLDFAFDGGGAPDVAPAGNLQNGKHVAGFERDIFVDVAGDGRADLDGLLIGDDLLAAFNLVAGQIGGLQVSAAAEAAGHADQIAGSHARAHGIFAGTKHIAIDPDPGRIDLIAAEDPHGIELLQGDDFRRPPARQRDRLEWSADGNRAARGE